MSDRKRETEFLKWLIGFGESEKCESLRGQFLKVEREEYHVRRAITLMSVLMLMAGSGLCYAAVFVPNWLGRGFPWMVRIFCALGLSAGISFVVCWGCWWKQRIKSNALRSDCREFIRGTLLTTLNTSDAFEIEARDAVLEAPDNIHALRAS